MKSVEERGRPGECMPINKMLLQAADTPCWHTKSSLLGWTVGSVNDNLPSGHCDLNQ